MPRLIDARLIDVSLLAIWSGALVIGKVQVAAGCGKLFRIDAGATRGALLKWNQHLLKLLTPRKKNYIQVPSVQDWSGASVLGFWARYNLNKKEKLNMGGDIIKGGEPKKKAKKKAAPKKAAKKKAAKK